MNGVDRKIGTLINARDSWMCWNMTEDSNYNKKIIRINGHNTCRFNLVTGMIGLYNFICLTDDLPELQMFNGGRVEASVIIYIILYTNDLLRCLKLSWVLFSVSGEKIFSKYFVYAILIHPFIRPTKGPMYYFWDLITQCKNSIEK